MRLFIKNMVCNRCRTAVAEVLTQMNLHPLQIDLGEVQLSEDHLDAERKQQLAEKLAHLGFELIDDRNTKMIEQIKQLVIQSIHYDAAPSRQKYSEQISSALNHDYAALSKLFSQVEGITIEQYILHQKAERVKELLAYDELSLTQIADKTGYSSVAHLSAQFKKLTGMTPTYFKNLRHPGRIPLDEVGRQAE